MKIAVEGCSHGELDRIYATIEEIQRRDGIKIDLLLCCGDFQAVRNEIDLDCMAVPYQKYRKMRDFYKYYSGEKKAPVLTVFIGGNHEASNHLWELPFGGWAAPNIYYMGYSGVVNFGGLRIAGLSGIYKQHDFSKGHFEKPPFDKGTMRSIYHTRSLDVFKLKLLSKPVNIGMSHDWPKIVLQYGDIDKLAKDTGFSKEQMNSMTLYNLGAEEVMLSMQPDHWFSAHNHVRYSAAVHHGDTSKVTNFLALDKCLEDRQHLQVVNVGPATGPLELSYDVEWLAITKLTLPLMNAKPSPTQLPRSEGEVTRFKPSKEAIMEVNEFFGNDLRIPHNFLQNAPFYNPAAGAGRKGFVQVKPNSTPQTDAFCEKLRIRNPFK